jgi:predicted HicB family RNase H-like nuclease
MARKSQQPSNQPREPFGVRLDMDLVTAIKILAAKKRTQVNLLVEEALRDLLRKYKDV